MPEFLIGRRITFGAGNAAWAIETMTNPQRSKGRLPFLAAAHRPFSHLIQIGGNVAERQIGIGNGDRRYQLHQMVFGRTARGPGQEVFSRELVAHQARSTVQS